MSNIVAFIGARSGSVRIAHKNIRLLAGHPLIAWTIRAAKESGIFREVFLSSDSHEYGVIGTEYGARWIPRPFPYNDPLSPDIDWLVHAKKHAEGWYGKFDHFAILRPTSPFRTSAQIRAAHKIFMMHADNIDSLRAVRRVKENPYKMWQESGGLITPMLTDIPGAHNQQSSALPQYLIQCGAIEIAHARNIDAGSMSGVNVLPYVMDYPEALDLNDETDWALAVTMIERGMVKMPAMNGEKVPHGN